MRLARQLQLHHYLFPLCQEAVDAARLADNRSWYTASARNASVALGDKGRDMIVERLRGLLARA